MSRAEADKVIIDALRNNAFACAADVDPRIKSTSRLANQIDAQFGELFSSLQRFPSGNVYIPRSQYLSQLDRVDVEIKKLRALVAKVSE